MEEAKIEEFINDLDTKIEKLSVDPKCESNLLVNDDDTNEVIENVTDNIETEQKPEPKNNEDINTINDKMKKEMLKKIMNMSDSERNKLMERMAKLKQVNPDDNRFKTCDETDRKELLKRYHERREQLSLRRKPKRYITGIKNNLMENLMKTQMDMNNVQNIKNVQDAQDVQDVQDIHKCDIKNSGGEIIEEKTDIENTKVPNNTSNSDDDIKEAKNISVVKKKKKMTKAQRKQRQKLNK